MSAIQRVNVQDKIFKCLWTGYGSRCRQNGLCQGLQCCWVFPSSTVSHVYQDWSTTQRTSSQLDTTVGSIGVKMGQHSCGTLSTPCRVHALTNWCCSEGNVRKMSLMFCTFSVYCSTEHPFATWLEGWGNVHLNKSEQERWRENSSRDIINSRIIQGKNIMNPLHHPRDVTTE